jgi:parallel beta-helix repeat protein
METTVIDGEGWGDVVWISADGVTVSGFTIRNGSFGIRIVSNSNTITGNTITSNSWYGIYLHGSSVNTITDNTITGNTISLNNKYGIYLFVSDRNTIQKNNFLDNKRAAFFYNNVEIKWKRNTWKQNYWNRPRILPKLIFGEIEVIEESIFMPWFNIDWRPAKKPYDI